MHTKTLAEQSDDLNHKRYSSEELTQHYLNRIKRLDPQINSFISLDEAGALTTARLADQKRAEGETGPLLGIPLAHKDIFCTQGLKTSCGSKMLDNFIAPYDATLVQKLKKAGTVLLGKTNMDEFAMGSSTENSFYGPTKNPWDFSTVPGGSSGGSSAAVAACLTPASTGTDTGGSIRQPAALCGVTGLKPTYGRVSRYGMIAFASSLDQAGPIARTAKDCALLLQAMAGFDTFDSTSTDLPVPDYLATLEQSIRGLKIGLPTAFFKDQPHPGVAAATEEALTLLKSLGATVQSIELPHIAYSIPTYYVIAPAECSSNLSRYDGVRFGYRCKDPVNLEDLYKRSRTEGFGTEVKRRILIGTHVLSSGYYDAYYRQAQQLRALIAQDFAAAFGKVDVILSPTTPTPAFALGDKAKDPLSMYLCDIYTVGVNLAGLPALSMPGGFVDQRPVGIQLIANHFEEARLLNVAHQFQQNTVWHQAIPTLFGATL